MKNHLEKPCVYHYLFSRLPVYQAEEYVYKVAGSLSLPLAKIFHLHSDEIFEPPHPDVTPILYKGNETSQTYLLQFRFNDILTSILCLNQTDQSEDSHTFFQSALDPGFPNPDGEMRFGEMSVLFAAAKANESSVREIAASCFDREIEDQPPFCQFEWGTIYFLPGIERYVLLIPNEKDLFFGDMFLSFDFPMLEAIRQKLIFEEGESKKLKSQNIKFEAELRELCELVTEKLDGTGDNLSLIEDLFDRIDDRQSELYDNVSKNEAVLHTLSINIGNFTTYLEHLPVKNDALFMPLLETFHFMYQKIKTELEYTKLLLPGLVKRQETISLKIALLRQKAQEQGNKIERMQNRLLAVLGVTLSVGEVISGTAVDWESKLLWMGLSGLLTYILVRFLELNVFSRKKKKE